MTGCSSASISGSGWQCGEIRMDREEFEELTAQAIAGLPTQFRSKLENVDVVVEGWPTTEQLAEAGLRGRLSLLGLYEGVPQTERGRGYNLVLPDKITIFRKPIESRCRSREELLSEIRMVVRHEIAHHFGLSDQALEEIEGD